jgi:hypothetical protein
MTDTQSIKVESINNTDYQNSDNTNKQENELEGDVDDCHVSFQSNSSSHESTTVNDDQTTPKQQQQQQKKPSNPIELLKKLEIIKEIK